MAKHFDFDEIGRKTPYRIPEGFFDEMQEHVLKQTAEQPRRSNSPLMRISYAVIGIAACAAAFIFIPHNDNETEQESESISWIEQISDEDLQAMDEIAEYDIFMN